jgi:hypothetical protein
MPSQKMQRPCGGCGVKDPVTSKFCSQCGAATEAVKEDDAANTQQHKDLAHPINTAFREYLQGRILEAYQLQKTTAPAEAETC